MIRGTCAVRLVDLDGRQVAGVFIEQAVQQQAAAISAADTSAQLVSPVPQVAPILDFFKDRIQKAAIVLAVIEAARRNIVGNGVGGKQHWGPKGGQHAPPPPRAPRLRNANEPPPVPPEPPKPPKGGGTIISYVRKAITFATAAGAAKDSSEPSRSGTLSQEAPLAPGRSPEAPPSGQMVPSHAVLSGGGLVQMVDGKLTWTTPSK